MENLLIITDFRLISFRKVALDIYEALKPHVNCKLVDWTAAAQKFKGSNILFFATLHHAILNYLQRFLPESNIVFYANCQGSPIMDTMSLKVAKDIQIVAVSEFVKKCLENIGLNVADVVHHGINMNSQCDEAYYEYLKEKTKGSSVILCNSGNHPRKALDKLLIAFKLVERDCPTTLLALHSGGGFYPIETLVSQLEIRNFWLTNTFGMLSPEKVNALYKLCEFYVAPAYSEGFCIPILEAYRWNKPSVSINHPPFNEIITPDETGLLIPYRSVSSYQDGNIEMTLKFDYSIDDLANAMIKLHQDSELREKMAEKIEAKKPNFDMFKQYPKLLEYF